MSGLLIAEFPDAAALCRSIGGARQAGYRPVDAFTPFPVEKLNELLEQPASHVRVTMFVTGIAIAVLAYAVEYFSAVIDYPINSGGRPLNSWPTFMLFPFAIGIFAAAVGGFAAMLTQAGLPRLHQPQFEVAGFGRASQSAFLLALAAPQGEAAHNAARSWLKDWGARRVWDIET
jgi:hypothetical protein